LSRVGTAATIRREVLLVELPTGTVTFLFTDVEESTAVVRRLGPSYAEALRHSRELLRSVFAEHGGTEVDTQGDSCFVAFTRARDAVLAAVDAQRSLASQDWPGGHALHVRMGLHTAEPHRWEEGYVGVGVHRAARICSVGHGGEMLLSRSNAGLIDDEDLPGVSLRDLGAHRLKGLDRPERIFQLLVDDLPSEFPPLNTVEGAGLATETLVILFGDMGAATPRSHESDPAEFRQLIGEYHRTIEAVLAEQGGQQMPSFGDGVAAVFRSARTALTTAEMLHRRLASRDWPGGGAVQMSVGLAAGEAVATAFGYFGEAVNASMALCSLARPGQTLVSDTVRGLLGGDDLERVELSSVGRRISEGAAPFEVYEVVSG
jgi:class 3 adenylate cyclase